MCITGRHCAHRMSGTLLMSGTVRICIAPRRSGGAIISSRMDGTRNGLRQYASRCRALARHRHCRP